MSLLSTLVVNILHGGLTQLVSDADTILQLASAQGQPGNPTVPAEIVQWNKVIHEGSTTLNINAEIGVPQVCDSNHVHDDPITIATFSGWLYQALLGQPVTVTYNLAIGSSTPEPLASLTDPSTVPTGDVSNNSAGVPTVSAITCIPLKVTVTKVS